MKKHQSPAVQAVDGANLQDFITTSTYRQITEMGEIGHYSLLIHEAMVEVIARPGDRIRLEDYDFEYELVDIFVMKSAVSIWLNIPREGENE